MNPGVAAEPTVAVEIELVPDATVAIVKLRGEHDIRTEPAVADALRQVSTHRQILIDLSHCTFIDSTLPRLIVQAGAAAPNVDLGIVIPLEAKAARRLADLTRLPELVSIFASRNAALMPVRVASRDDLLGTA